MKHIETLDPVDQANLRDMTHRAIEHHDMTVPLDCYFDPYDGSLWHVFLGTTELYNVLAKAVINELEEEFLLLELTT